MHVIQCENCVIVDKPVNQVDTLNNIPRNIIELS